MGWRVLLTYVVGRGCVLPLRLIPASCLHPLYLHHPCPWHLGRGAARRTALGSCHPRHLCRWLRRGHAARRAHLSSRHLHLNVTLLTQQMEAVGASESVLHLRWPRHHRGRRGSTAPTLQLVTVVTIGRCDQSTCCCLLYSHTYFTSLFPPSPLFSIHTLHPHLSPLILYVPPSDGIRL